ncbi:MAG TPA: universal stress protein [Solirubrobacteraceae bacterium]|nr:universal stress protein [Solirubrobacteraceae bacterium]
MFNNVLVGVDGRPTGRDAIALASRLIDRDGKLTLAHVHSGPMRPSHAVTPGLLREEREASAKLLEQERASSEVSAELVSVVGLSPGRALHQQAEEQHADLLVVGSCSRGVLGRTMLGDDTRGALNGAPCAIAIASLGYAEHPTPLAKIGVGYDGSPESKLALQTAREIAQATRASVDALEVVSLPTYGYTGILPPLTGDGLDEMLQEASARMEKLPDVHGHAVCGLTGEELATFTNTVDLLIVGSRGYGPMKRMMLGSTSTYLERHARCSLLVMPRNLLAETADEEQQADPQGIPEPAEPHAGVR